MFSPAPIRMLLVHAATGAKAISSGQNNTKTDVEGRKIGTAAATHCTPAVNSIEIPTATANHAVGARCRSLRVGHIPSGTSATIILTPRPYIPVHIRTVETWSADEQVHAVATAKKRAVRNLPNATARVARTIENPGQSPPGRITPGGMFPLAAAVISYAR
jgi:hypothetical protein